ncbi:hypothetical protein V8C34DRAFT_287615 [Trichoderma compactum]
MAFFQSADAISSVLIPPPWSLPSKKCCGPAPVVQYSTNGTIQCGAYCPIVSNGPNRMTL